MKNKFILLLLFCIQAATPLRIESSNRDISDMTKYLIAEIAKTAILSATAIYIQNQALKWQNMSIFKVNKQGSIQESFSSVAGNHEAKEALEDIIDFLKNPDKYHSLGAKVPKGVLLTGNPGTGKTLLARALAGEANCSFIHATGSQFTQIFMGMGSLRVQELFQIARRQRSGPFELFKQKPCIIFIDEIDALCKRRDSNFSNSEDSKTLNQLLSEMDGFTVNGQPIIVIGATNHVDTLDPAVLRPGRFDRIVEVSLPRKQDRIDILNIHLQKVSHQPDLDIEKIAQATSGFSGAQLENIINQAAIICAKKNKSSLDLEDLSEAYELITLGAPSKSLTLKEYDKKVTAYHEAGHALISLLLPTPYRCLDMITIMPRDKSLGLNTFTQEEDLVSLSKDDMIAIITMALGGRAAEELIFKKLTSGASSDFQQATLIARSMICNYGMTNALGKQVLLPSLQQGFQYSQKTLEKIDEEVSQILEEQYEKAKQLLTEHNDKLELLAQALLEKETMYVAEVRELLSIKNNSTQLLPA